MIKSKKIRISFMNLDEVLLTRVEGMATNGSINIDGSSAVRRTCQLNFISNELKPVNYFELYKTKFLLEIDFGNGFKKQGIYLLTSFSSSISTNNYTFNISGKDKMCLLNGEHGGSFPFSIDVGTQEKIEYNFEPLVTFEYKPGKYYYQNKGEYVLDYAPYGSPDKIYYKRLVTSQKEKLTIKNIISNIVTVYGKEQKHNIFINDLEIRGLELLEYRGSDPLYLFRDVLTGKITDITIDPKFSIFPQLTDEFNDSYTITLDSLTDEQFFSTSVLKNSSLEEQAIQVAIAPSYNKLYVIRIQYGEPIGYRDTDLTYAGELTANINENVVSILDKIKNMLGNYEYFYDEEGHFIFQKRQDYASNQFSTISVDGLGMEYASTPLYLCPQIELKNISSIGQNPQFQNIKNDFSIWGTRSSESGSLPIHSRIAIHQKPEKYVTYNNICYQVEKDYDSLISQKITLDEEIQKQTSTIQDQITNIYFANTPEYQETFYEAHFNDFMSTSTDYNSDPQKRKQFLLNLAWIGCVDQIVTYLGDQFAQGLIENDYFPIVDKTVWGPMLVNLLNVLCDVEKINLYLNKKEERISFADDIEYLLNTWIYETWSLNIKFSEDQCDFLNKFNYINWSFLWYNYWSKTPGVIHNTSLKYDHYNEIFELPLIKDYFNTCRKNIDYVILVKAIENQQSVFNKFFDFYGWDYRFEADERDDYYFYWIGVANSSLEYGADIEAVQQRLCESKRTRIDAKIWEFNQMILKNQSDFNQIYQEYFPSKESLNTIRVSDWREILYQMAKDYYDNGTQPDFWQKINEYNDNQYLSWKTGYEAFYEDILGFWRQLYFDPLYEPLDYELPIGYNIEDYVDYNGWHKDVYENPNGLNFWIDFIEPSGELSAYAIDQIGVKGKYENSSTVKSIAVKQPPALKVLTNTEWELLGENPDPNYSYVQLEGILANSYTISAQGISALEHTQNLLFNHTYLQESITLSLIPDESLRVNSRVKLNAINVNGEFTISKITLPLAYNGMMSVTLTKIPPTLTTEIIMKEFE